MPGFHLRVFQLWGYGQPPGVFPKHSARADEHIYKTGRKGELNERTRLRPLASPQDIMQMDAGHLIAWLPDSRAARLRRASPQLFGGR